MSGQVGFAVEGTWGTSQTPTIFLPLRSFKPTYDPGIIQSQAIRAGQLAEDRGYPGAIKAGGAMQVELCNTGVAVLLEQLFGAVVVDDANDPIFESTYNLGAPTTGMTVQGGSEDVTGVVRPFTLLGAMANSFKLSTSVSDGIALLDLDLPAKDLVKTTALASASYPVAAPFTFPQTTLTVGGSPFLTATSAEISINKGLKVDRHHLGSRYINQQRNVQRWAKSGSFAAEFESVTMFDHLVAVDDVALVQEWDNGDGQSLTITANIQITGEPPGVSTQGIEPQAVNFRICRPEGGDDADAITAVLVNDEDPTA